MFTIITTHEYKHCHINGAGVGPADRLAERVAAGRPRAEHAEGHRPPGRAREEQGAMMMLSVVLSTNMHTHNYIYIYIYTTTTTTTIITTTTTTNDNTNNKSKELAQLQPVDPARAMEVLDAVIGAADRCILYNSSFDYICVYIYIYIYSYSLIYVERERGREILYIYIYREREIDK